MFRDASRRNPARETVLLCAGPMPGPVPGTVNSEEVAEVEGVGEDGGLEACTILRAVCNQQEERKSTKYSPEGQGQTHIPSQRRHTLLPAPSGPFEKAPDPGVPTRANRTDCGGPPRCVR